MVHAALERMGDWDMSLAYKQASPGFEIKDAGFQGRVDYRAATSFVGKRQLSPWGVFRNAFYGVGSTHV
jgi:hypothetical protein